MELITAMTDKKQKPSLIEADKMKNLAKKPAKGGIPANENKNTNIEIAFDLDDSFNPFNPVKRVISPSGVRKFKITENTPNVVIRYIIK